MHCVCSASKTAGNVGENERMGGCVSGVSKRAVNPPCAADGIDRVKNDNKTMAKFHKQSGIYIINNIRDTR